SQDIPSLERNQYSNKQSARVNAGLGYGVSHSETEAGVKATAEQCTLSGNTSAVDMDFSQLNAAFQLPLPTSPTVEHLVRTLLHPQPHAFPHGVLSMQWVIGALGQTHFRFRESDERYILAPDSIVRTEGMHLGLPPAYLEWLCGNEEGSSPTEQGMLLTPDFFE
ncbi:hypothetical protein EJ07DRAFT_66528, partial [Lizonia empirigonia]